MLLNPALEAYWQFTSSEETLFLGDLLTRVVDDLRASLDLSLCKYTPTVNL